MKIKTTMTLVAALCALALTSHAQDDGPLPDGGQGGPGGGRGHHRPPPPIIAALDVNHDGIIDSNEIANASAELLTLDKNGDGKLTPDELRPQRPQFARDGQAGDTNSEPSGPPGADQGGPGGQGGPGSHHHPVSPVMAALDTNHDGTLDASEIANASAALKTLDKNGDGKLTPDELRPQHPDGGPGGDHGDGGDHPDGPPPGDQ